MSIGCNRLLAERRVGQVLARQSAGSSSQTTRAANTGSKVFNVSHIQGKLTTSSGKTIRELPRFEYAQQLGPREQRSLRYPLPIDAEMPVVTQVYYIHYPFMYVSGIIFVFYHHVFLPQIAGAPDLRSSVSYD